MSDVFFTRDLPMGDDRSVAAAAGLLSFALVGILFGAVVRLIGKRGAGRIGRTLAERFAPLSKELALVIAGGVDGGVFLGVVGLALGWFAGLGAVLAALAGLVLLALAAVVFGGLAHGLSGGSNRAVTAFCGMIVGAMAGSTIADESISGIVIGAMAGLLVGSLKKTPIEGSSPINACAEDAGPTGNFRGK